MPPSHFKFSFHNAWHMPIEQVEWLPELQLLEVRSGIGAGPRHRIPERRWKAFWKKMQAMGIWVWPEDFARLEDEMICDGWGWDMEIQHAGLRLKTGGINTYPPDEDGRNSGNGNRGETRTFQKLRAAIRALHAGTEVVGGHQP